MRWDQGPLDYFARLPGSRRLLWFLAKRFIAGETTEDALNQAIHLNTLGLPVILDYVGENKQSYEAIQTAEEKYLEVLSLAGKRDLSADVSLKPSQFGLVVGSCRHWWEDNPEILSVLQETNQSTAQAWLDAELLETRDSLWDFVEFALGLKNISFLGAALQAYANAGFNSKYFFENRIAPLTRFLPKGKTLGLRLCKGAYQSSERWILRDSREVRWRYLELTRSIMELTLTNQSRTKDTGTFLPEFATHDLELIYEIKLMAERLGLAKNWFRFAMLYGRQQSFVSHLVAEGYTIFIYLPFGPEWLAYVSRRLQENKAYFLLPFLSEGEYHLCPEWPDECILLKK